MVCFIYLVYSVCSVHFVYLVCLVCLGLVGEGVTPAPKSVVGSAFGANPGEARFCVTVMVYQGTRKAFAGGHKPLPYRYSRLCCQLLTC